MCTVWWLRPVSIAARVGAQIAVVWNRLKRRPSAATRSRPGAGTGPPKAPNDPKPTSSRRTITTLGAPSGAPSILRATGWQSSVSRPMEPACGGVGRGMAVMGGSNLPERLIRPSSCAGGRTRVSDHLAHNYS